MYVLVVCIKFMSESVIECSRTDFQDSSRIKFCGSSRKDSQAVLSLRLRVLVGPPSWSGKVVVIPIVIERELKDRIVEERRIDDMILRHISLTPSLF